MYNCILLQQQILYIHVSNGCGLVIKEFGGYASYSSIFNLRQCSNIHRSSSNNLLPTYLIACMGLRRKLISAIVVNWLADQTFRLESLIIKLFSYFYDTFQ